MIQKARQAQITRAGIDQELYGIGRLTLRMEQIEAGMQSRIDAIKAEQSPTLEDLRARIEGLAERLRLRVEDSRPDLFAKKRKMVAVLMGKIGFRKQPDRVTLKPGLAEKDVLIALHARDRMEFLRMTEAIDRRAVADALREGGVDEATLQSLGLRVRLGRDEFYYDLNRDSVLDRMKKEG